MKLEIINKSTSKPVNSFIYGQFIEHFHRQIYGGVYDPNSKFADEDGFRSDVIEAMRKIKVPILRWPGGCFVSAYHWKEGVGPDRKPMFDKAWRVEEPNEFGTDEYIKMCRKIGCEPYICTNAGTGTAEEMSDWVEYCNLKHLGKYSLWREENGFNEPHNVKYWSIGNENYGFWEIGAKTADEWGHLVTESAKMMKRVDPTVELSAAALADMDWNTEILKNCGDRLDWISLHGYWDFHEGQNKLADYETCMKYTYNLDAPVKQVKGLMSALGYSHIKIAYDEWNLRAWYHPNIMDLYQGVSPEEYLTPRNDNDINSQYTMADAVFTGCFLNMCIRNCDVIGMANFSPVVNTRGMIYTHDDGIVLRSTYHVFDAYVNDMESNYLETVYIISSGSSDEIDTEIDYVATVDDSGRNYSLSLINRNPDFSKELTIALDDVVSAELVTVNGPDKDSYNDVGKDAVVITRLVASNDNKSVFINTDSSVSLRLEPHSVNVLKITTK